MTLLGGEQGQDPILFVQDLIRGFIKDELGNPVNITTIYPKKINQIPRVAVDQQEESMEFISIPAVRRRWTAPFILRVWATSVAQRYAIKQSILTRLDTLSHPNVQLADNYVYMFFKVHKPVDDPMTYGQPVYKIDFTITLIYDTLTVQAGVAG